MQYLIITNAVMQPQLQRLADWRTRTGVPTVVRTVEFIQANYPYGVDLQDRIRRFIKDAYLQWGTTHVLLAGDTDIIPPRYGFTTFFSGNYIPTDLYFSDLDGNWNADGDSLFGEAFSDSIEPGRQPEPDPRRLRRPRADHQPGAGHDVRRQDAAVQPHAGRRLREQAPCSPARCCSRRTGTRT